MIDEKKLIDHIKSIEMSYQKAWEQFDSEYDFGGMNACGAIIAYIEDMQKICEWIPFTVDDEGILNCELPEEDQEILISDGKDVYEDIFMYDDGAYYLDGWNRELGGLAWMPKPDVWKKE